MNCIKEKLETEGCDGDSHQIVVGGCITRKSVSEQELVGSEKSKGSIAQHWRQAGI